jgi:uncharacterized membrane protein
MRTDPTCLPVLVLALLVPVTPAQADPGPAKGARKYSVVEIALPADPHCVAGFHTATFARRLNERGEVTGSDLCNVATGDETFPILAGASDAFRWDRTSGATMLPSITADAIDTFGRDINESGTVVGQEFKADGTVIAPLWPRSGGVSEAFQPAACDPFFPLAFGQSINDRGTVLGLDDRAGENGFCTIVWILKLASGEEIVGPRGVPQQVNNRDVAAGQRDNAAVRWSPATGEVVLFQDPTGRSVGHPWSINDRNEVVGHVFHQDDQACVVGEDPMFWAANAAATTLGTLPGDERGVAFNINRKGQIVGSSFNQADPCDVPDPAQSRAVIWRGIRPVDLNTLVPRRFAREFQLTFASAINDRGQIVARAVRRGEPKLPCPRIDFDPETGENVYNASITCHNEYSFLLTPKH